MLPARRSTGLLSVRPRRLVAAFCAGWLVAGVCLPAGLDVAGRVAYGQGLLRFPVRENDQFYQLTEADVEDLPNEAATHLARVEQLVANQNWDEAVETLRSVAENYGPHLIQAGSPDRAGGHLYTNLRHYCQQQFAKLPAPVRQLYRDRVDTVAEEWFQQGVETRDPDLLQRVVENMYCSSYGDDALLALGDIALEQGRVDTARWCWEQINPLTRFWDGRSPWYALAGLEVDQWKEIRQQLEQENPQPTWFAYPDSDVPLADVRARLVLASILQGDRQRARLELDLFQQLHGEASGFLAGRDANYHDTLQKLLSGSAEWPRKTSDEDWPTFAHAMDRNQLRSESFDMLGPPDWTILYTDLRLQRTGTEPSRPHRDPDAALMYHPTIVGDLLVVKSRDSFAARSLVSGEPVFAKEMGGRFYPPMRDDETAFARERRGQLSEPRYTMTVRDNLLYARVGSQATTRPRELVDPRMKNKLVCLDLRRQGTLKWQFPAKPDDPEFEGWALEGAPVVDEQGVYVCMRRVDAQPEIFVACLEPSPGSVRVRWRRRVCTANFPTKGRASQYSHSMLTLSEGRLFLGTNLGTVAALRCRDGLIQWVYRYPRTMTVDLDDPPHHFYRHVNPCVYYRGLVIFAPRDRRQIMALDAGSGSVVWRSEPIGDPRHLLGIGNGNLIATGRSVWWLNVRTGRAQFVWPHPDNGEAERGFGRGLLAGNNVYWPTRDKILILDQRIKRVGQRRSFYKNSEFDLSAPNINAQGGNLIVGGNTLVIAGTQALYGFHLKTNPQSANRN